MCIWIAPSERKKYFASHQFQNEAAGAKLSHQLNCAACRSDEPSYLLCTCLLRKSPVLPHLTPERNVHRKLLVCSMWWCGDGAVVTEVAVRHVLFPFSIRVNFSLWLVSMRYICDVWFAIYSILFSPHALISLSMPSSRFGFSCDEPAHLNATINHSVLRHSPMQYDLSSSVYCNTYNLCNRRSSRPINRREEEEKRLDSFNSSKFGKKNVDAMKCLRQRRKGMLLSNVDWWCWIDFMGNFHFHSQTHVCPFAAHRNKCLLF